MTHIGTRDSEMCVMRVHFKYILVTFWYSLQHIMGYINIKKKCHIHIKKRCLKEGVFPQIECVGRKDGIISVQHWGKEREREGGLYEERMEELLCSMRGGRKEVAERR